MKRISSRDNAEFKSLRELVEDHRAPRRRREALIEGLHLAEVCLERGALIKRWVLGESALENAGVRALLERDAAPSLRLSDALYRTLTGLAAPSGIAAVIGLPVAGELPTQGDVLVLDGVQDAGNVGTLLRTAAAAGIRQVVLGHGCASAWTLRVLRAGQGAHFGLVLHEQIDLPAFLDAYRDRRLATVAQGGDTPYALDLSLPTAWLLGSEGAGLSAEVRARADHAVTIPLAAQTESLNVAAAAAVCLFEGVRQRRLASTEF